MLSVIPAQFLGYAATKLLA